MKRIVVFLFTVALLASCGPGKKIARQAEKSFKGDWTLTNVSYPNNSGFVDVTLLGDASTKCFVNSDWHFVSNNNKGTYVLNNAGCGDGERAFVWDVQVADADSGLYDFTLKPVGEGENARKVSTGYRMNLASLDENSMVWEQTVSYEGKPFLIRMNFVKQY